MTTTTPPFQSNNSSSSNTNIASEASPLLIGNSLQQLPSSVPYGSGDADSSSSIISDHCSKLGHHGMFFCSLHNSITVDVVLYMENCTTTNQNTMTLTDNTLTRILHYITLHYIIYSIDWNVGILFHCHQFPHRTCHVDLTCHLSTVWSHPDMCVCHLCGGIVGIVFLAYGRYSIQGTQQFSLWERSGIQWGL
jgi:hypothetical protein